MDNVHVIQRSQVRVPWVETKIAELLRLFVMFWGSLPVCSSIYVSWKGSAKDHKDIKNINITFVENIFVWGDTGGHCDYSTQNKPSML